jgi:TPR repeat protein
MKKLSRKERSWKYHDIAYNYFEKEDINKAIYYYLKSANLGFLPAQHMLGYIYWERKHGIPRNEKKSKYWYKRAIRNGLVQSARNLALNYKEVNNLRWYKYWFKKAADMGDSDARRELRKLNSK